jgi:hypothetical protein
MIARLGDSLPVGFQETSAVMGLPPHGVVFCDEA